MLDLSQTQLADASRVSLSTVVDFERRRRVVSEQTVATIRSALETAGVEFIEENGGGAGVRLRKG